VGSVRETAGSAPARATLRQRLAVFGPAFVAAVAYVDPGNVATNTAAGGRYGYLLVWVLVLANLMAGQVQYLSAKLGVVTGRSLPEAVRDHTSTPVRLAYWAQAELIAAATDLAEVVGGALALRLLFGLPMLLGGAITGLVATLLLLVQDRFGQHPFERVVLGFLGVITIGCVAGLFVIPPDPAAMLRGLVPRFAGMDSLLLATGMLGATVMPHAIYLHSALARDGGLARFPGGLPERGPKRRRLLGATRVDVVCAMLIAGAVNLAMLLLAATALRGAGDVDSISGVHHELRAVLGPGIAVLFAVGLLASGFASTSVGCYAGSVVMSGLLQRRIPLLLRRLVTLVPALVVLGAGADPTTALVVSQVVLSFGIPFALIPLVALTSKRSLMGEDANHRATTGIAAVVTALVVVVNIALIATVALTGDTP
jgi:manganese transport protein